jgi:hypothetical protein
MKLTTRGRAVLSWIGAIALLAMAPEAMALRPVVEIGPDRTIIDNDNTGGELIDLAVESVSDPDGDPLTYVWLLTPPSGGEFAVGYGPNPAPIHTTIGVSTIRVVVTDDDEESATDSYQLTILPRASNSAPTVSAGPDRSVTRAPGQNVELNASGSDSDGTIESYTWYLDIGDGSQRLGEGQSLSADLSDGTNYISVVATDNLGATGSDTVVITVTTRSSSPTADAGADRTVDDVDHLPGESVSLDGRASTDPDDDIVSFLWELLGGDGPIELGRDALLSSVPLHDGENVIRLTVTDRAENFSTDTVVITVNAPTANVSPNANAGADRSVADTDRATGENVVLDGSASTDSDGSIASYTWSRVNGETIEELGSGQTLQTRLTDGENVIRLVVTDNSGGTASDTVTITVGVPAAVAPTANAGADRNIADTDAQDGEEVVLDGSYSVDPDGTLVSYAWSRVIGDTTESLGSGQSPMLQTRLADGEHVIRLVVTDNAGNTASDTVIIRVNAVIVTTLENIPGLSPNQKRMAQALDRVCG